jgi:hypothetical protein
MKHDTAVELLNDYTDGELEAPQAEELEEHVRQCVTCRRELEGLRQVLEGAAALPRSIEPATDLWPAIADATRLRETAAENVGTRLLQRLGFFSWSWPTALATAAVVGVLCFSSFNTEPLVQTGQDLSSPGITTPSQGDEEATSLVNALEAECLQGERELAAYDGSSDHMTQLLMESMPVVDRAIAEARAAWLDSPENPGLARLLTMAYRAKVALQGRAIRMASRT